MDLSKSSACPIPFIRTRTIRGIAYNYLVESYREDGKPHQRILAYLGEHKTVAAAHSRWSEQAKTAPDAVSRKHAREMMKRLEQYL